MHELASSMIYVHEDPDKYVKNTRFSLFLLFVYSYLYIIWNILSIILSLHLIEK